MLLAAQAQADTGAAGWWSSLWRNADQRGEALLQQGQPAEAAKTYADPRRKAQAQFKAGDYAAAAQELSSLNDSEAHYNRGNALAHAGDLAAALKAYDAALKLAPQHADARHNRDLVAKALAQQQAADKTSRKTGNRASPRTASQVIKRTSCKTAARTARQTTRKASRKSPHRRAHPVTSRAMAPTSHRMPNQATNRGTRPMTSQAARGTTSQPLACRNPAPLPPAHRRRRRPTQPRPRQPPTMPSRPAVMPRPACKRLKLQRLPLLPKGRAPLTASRPGPAPQAAPLTENQMAQEQWLRSIPDDPGGLLRRKFMIQHLMRQRDAKP